MPKRLLDRLTLFGRAWLDVTIPTGSVRPTQRRYAVDLLDMSDPPRFRDEAVVTLHELLNLGVRGHFMPSRSVPSCTRGTHYGLGVGTGPRSLPALLDAGRRRHSPTRRWP